KASSSVIRPAGTTTADVFFADATSSYVSSAYAFQVRANLSCYSTNLRSVANPISPTAAVQMIVELNNHNTFSVVFPGYLVAADRDNLAVAPNLVSYLDGVR